MAKNYITNPGEAIAEAIAALGVSTDELCKEFNEVLTNMEKNLDGYLGYCQGKQVYATTMAEYLERKWVYCGTFVVITDERFKVKGARPVVKGTTGRICAWRTDDGQWDWNDDTQKQFQSQMKKKKEKVVREETREEDRKWLVYF